MRSLSFGAGAVRYERYRPDYPRWVLDEVLAYASGAVTSAVEVGAPMELADDEVREVVEQARRDLDPNDDVQAAPSGHSSRGLPWPQQELLESKAFSDVELRKLAVTRAVDAEDYVGNLSTVSSYLLLGARDRDAALQRIRAVLPDRVEVRLDLDLHLARRTDGLL